VRQLGTYPFDEAIDKVLNHASIDWDAAKSCRGGKGVKLVCILPKHNDTVPSLVIDRTSGRFRCYGCGQKGSIYDLGKLIGIDLGTGKETDVYDSDIDEFAVMSEKLDLIESPDTGLISPPPHLRPLPPGLSWRGMPSSFLSEAGAKLWYDPRSYIERVWFPCMQDGELIGWFARIKDEKAKDRFKEAMEVAEAAFERFKKKNGAKSDPAHLRSLEDDYLRAKKRLEQIKSTKYRNNDKQKTHLITFPLDLVLSRMPGTKTVALVEGQVDALWLIYHGIPALAILGTNNWSSAKEAILLSHGFTRIVLAMDGDEAGERCQDKLYKELRGRFKVFKWVCPEGEDPASVGKKHLRELKGLCCD
jgi:hypothetical protein